MMIPSRYRPLFIFLFILLCVVLLLTFAFDSFNTKNAKRILEVVYLDVGQGDATFIESPSGSQVLIDGGRDAAVLRGLTKTMGYFDRDIDLVIATHPDLDHIGGLIDVLKRYNVHTILTTENKSDTPGFELFVNAMRSEGATIIYARRGQVLDLGFGEEGSTTLKILFPDRDPSGLESNMASIITQLRYGDIEFMFTGDSPQAIEEYLVSIDGDALASEVLKAGHHGSRTSSASNFVESVHPTYAIISAGKDNKYGHPHKEVTDLFGELGIVTKNTAEVGSISLKSDGQSVWFK